VKSLTLLVLTDKEEIPKEEVAEVIRAERLSIVSCKISNVSEMFLRKRKKAIRIRYKDCIETAI
jgi:hypothetical protein